jgi:hypothetical protein
MMGTQLWGRTSCLSIHLVAHSSHRCSHATTSTICSAQSSWPWAPCLPMLKRPVCAGHSVG